MSYCRWIDGDLYIYHSVPKEDGTPVGLVCCGCRLHPSGGDYSALKRSTMIRHIREHEGAGHDVQKYVIPALEAEMKHGDDVTEVAYR